jgi:hemoglobin/transferrin/lactoferrin receptor protein
MTKFGRAAILCGGVSLLALASVETLTLPAAAQAVSRNAHSFNIGAKSLLAALADYTAVTGIQVVRPGSTPITGRTNGVSGQYSAEAALQALLAGSGLSYQVTGPRTVVIHQTTGAESANFTPGGDAIQLAPIDVSGTGGGLAPVDGVGTVKITTEDLDQSNPSNLQDVFAGEPGISVGSSIPMSQKVYVHGVEETNLAVSVDGGRQNNRVFHHNANTLVDPSLLKQVEVNAGVAPADAGPGALAGSIAYETRDVGDLLEDGKNFGGFGKLSYDTNSETITTGVSAYGRSNGFEALGYINYGNGENFEDGSGTEVLGSEANFITGIGKLAYQAEDGHRFELSHEQIKDEADRPFRPDMQNLAAPPAGQPSIRPYDLHRKNTVFTYTNELADGLWDPKIVLAYSETDLDTVAFCRPAFCGVNTLNPALGSGDSLNGKVENKFNFAFGTLTTGVDFYHDTVSLESVTPSAPPVDDTSDESATNIGAYAQARIEPADDVRFSFGMRADQQWFEGTGGQEFDDAGLSGNASVEYDVVSFLTLKAGYSNVWAGVPLAESFVMNPLWNYGNSGPESVTAQNVVAGFIARHEGFSLEGGVFRTEIEDVRQPGYNAARALINYDVDSEGFEIGAGYDWENGFFRVKYANIDTYINGVIAVSDYFTGGTAFVNKYLGAPVGEIITITTAHTFVDWGLTLGGNIEIALDYDKTQIAADPSTRPLPGYETVSVFAEYVPEQLPNLTLRGEVNNIFDENYTNRTSYGGDSIYYLPLREPGRSFLLSAKATF